MQSTEENVNKGNCVSCGDKLTRISNLSGVMTALITPMQNCPPWPIDFEALRHIIKWQTANGICGFIVAGTTGESAALTEPEWVELVTFCVKESSPNVAIIVGTGTNCTRTSIDKTVKARDLGADGALLVAPYYIKPTQEGLFQHYKTVAESVPGFPLILYNVPSRTACDILPATVKRIADTCNNIVGIKECVGNQRCLALRELCGPKFRIYSGEDGDAAEAVLSHGANGMVSVAGIAAPAEFTEMYRLAADGNVKCRDIAEQLKGLVSALFTEPNPTCIKWLMSKLKMAPSGIRLPLLPPSQGLQDRLSTLAATLKVSATSNTPS